MERKKYTPLLIEELLIGNMDVLTASGNLDTDEDNFIDDTLGRLFAE